MGTTKPTAAPITKASQIVDGVVKNPKVVDTTDVIGTLQHGGRRLSDIHAIVLHQTGGASATGSLDAWKKGKKEGTHFLIDTGGTVYQVAKLTQKTWHVGALLSRCIEEKTCSQKDSNESKILFAKGQGWSVRDGNLRKFEEKKAYPQRYPRNDDSIGIELVGQCLPAASKTCAYETPSVEQNIALTKLVQFLKGELGLTDSDVFRHPQIAHKVSTEAKGADWRVPLLNPSSSAPSRVTPARLP